MRIWVDGETLNRTGCAKETQAEVTGVMNSVCMCLLCLSFLICKMGGGSNSAGLISVVRGCKELSIGQATATLEPLLSEVKSLMNMKLFQS